MPRNEHLRPKTDPYTRSNKGRTRHPSDAPTPDRTELFKLAVTSNFCPSDVGSDGSSIVRPVFQVDKFGDVRERIARIPIVCKPLTPVFHTTVGGGRVGGGGTSREALQRAKKKAKLQKARFKRNVGE